jgi:Carboxypeptidase regulatory-like domain
MRRLVVAVFVGLLALAPIRAVAQGQNSAVQGHVLDESGAALPGVTVVLTHQGSGQFRQVVSNADGSYFLTNLIPGPYKITADLTGFKKYERPDVVLQIGNTATLDITLAVGGLEESVTVSGTSPLVDVTSKQIGANIAEAEIAALPIMNKNWMFAVGLTPGIQVASSTASFACESLIVGGGSNRSGNFSIDGSGNNDDYLGSSCGSQVRPALETVQEFQVLTNQYDAEFGRTAGAIVNAITKQGTNVFHGALFGSFTNHAITAEDFFVAQNNLSKPETKQTDWGGTIGGPVKKDKAHFFYSLDRLVYAEGRSNTFAARPELNYSNTQRMNLWNHMIRFDNQVNQNHAWTARYTIEVSPTYDRVSGRVSQAGRDQEFDDDRLAGGSFNSIFGNNRFNTIRAGYTYEKNGFTDARIQNGTPQTELAPTLTMATFADGPPRGAQFRINDSYEISEAFSQFVPSFLGGDHDVKVGGQYIYSTINLPDQTDMNGRFFFSSDRAFDASIPGTYPERLQIRVPSASNILMPNNVFVLFAQDKWHRGNLTLNLGMRYDLEILPLTNSFNPFFSNGDHAVDKNNIAPRLGFTWKPSATGTSIVRGGYGTFYDKITMITTTPFVSTGVYSDSFTASFPASAVDPGPSRGQLPTNSMLINGPVVNRAAINALFPPGSMGRNTGQVFLDNPDRKVPQVQQLSLGYERQIGQHMAVTADYIRSWNRDQLINYDMNPGLRVDTSRSGQINYTDLENIAGQLGISPFVNPVVTRVNDGSSDFDGLNFSLEKRYSSRWAARVSYAVGYARGNAEASQLGENNYQLGADPQLDRNYGPLDGDRRQNIVVNGRVEIPKTGGLTVSAVARYMTGSSMTLINSAVDADRNGRLFDLLPAGNYCGVGVNSICVDNDGRRNGAKGPSFRQTDMKFAYRFHPGKDRTIDANLELYNLFNTANFSNPGSVVNGASIVDQRLSDFLVLTALNGGNGQPRALQFSVRLGF